MFIGNNKTSEEVSEREMKVRIPADIHLQLHSIKLLTGKPISDSVTEALELYFQHVQEAKRNQAQASA